MHESMFWTNWSGFLVAALLCLLTGQATEGTAFCTRHPEVLNAILIYSVARGAALHASAHHGAIPPHRSLTRS